MYARSGSDLCMTSCFLLSTETALDQTTWSPAPPPAGGTRNTWASRIEVKKPPGCLSNVGQETHLVQNVKECAQIDTHRGQDAGIKNIVGDLHVVIVVH